MPIERVGRVPVTLMRSSLVTRDPEQMGEALQAYEDGVAPIDFLLPQRVQWQQWKHAIQTGGASRPLHRPPLMAVEGLYEAMLTGRGPAYLMGLHPEVRPIAEQAVALSGDFWSAPFDEADVLTRDAPAEGRPVVPPFIGEEPVELAELPPHYEEDRLGAPQGLPLSRGEVALNRRHMIGWVLSSSRGR